MKYKFIEKRFSRSSEYIIETANQILLNYKHQGFKLSLRQLYYQFVARDIFPEDRKWSYKNNKWVRDPRGTKNADPNYKWLGDIISDARLAGLMDWDMIEDRGREAFLPAAWSSPAEIVMAAAKQFRVDRWEGQENYVEVMVEKDALSGILQPVCSRLHVRFTANKGYSSSSAMFEAGARIYDMLTAKDSAANTAHIFYLGDHHDPSGIDMTRDITERLIQFSRLDTKYYDPIIVHRIALNYDQVEQWNPPENPAKQTDARYAAYRQEFGESSWELDAVEPKTLANLLQEGITNLIDTKQWDLITEREQAMRDELIDYARNYGKPRSKKSRSNK